MDEKLYNEAIKDNDFELVKQIKDEEKRIQCLIMMNATKKEIFYEEILNLKNDDLKIKYINFLIYDSVKTNVLKSLKDDKQKIECINKIFTNYYKGELIKTISDEKLLIDYYQIANPFVQYLIMTNISNETFKIKHLYDFILDEQIDIIKTLSDEQKKQFINVRMYKKYIIDILSTIKDKQFIIDYFNNIKETQNRLKLISLINDKNLKNELVDKLGETIYKHLYNTNKKEVKEDIIDNTKIKNVNYDIDPTMTFGVELEACTSDRKNLLYLQNIINNWKIIEDASVPDGLEIVSPVLHYEERDLKQLQYICNFMRACHFYTNDNCGGHIHFGYDYLKTIKQVNNLLNIYCNCENIFYAICNKAGMKSRDEVELYAKKIDGIVYKISNINKGKIGSLNEYTKIIKKIPDSRYYGLNLKNIGNRKKNTLEFRIPNGEIEFDQIINNIRLFAKLLEVSKNLQSDNYEYNVLMNNILSDREKLNLLLDLLFDNELEKKIYKKRYRRNANIIKTFKKTKPIKI